MNKQLQRLLMLAVFMVMAAGVIQAQRTITGTVKSESGEPMIGVNIMVVGTTLGTVSDFDGGYTLQVPEGSSQIAFSYTGYDRVVVDLGANSTVDVVMGEGALLEDVVVTGYGTVRRENVTGSIVTVKSDEFNRGSITSAQELIAGKIAGVQVVTGGDPGGGSVIRIRGGSSLSATNDPLIVIDGVPVANDRISGSRNNLNIVNPNDIETFTVLKDASATAIYGSRASNGVILITTKKGTVNDKFSLEYNGSVASSSIAERADVLSADEYRGLIRSLYPDSSHQAYALIGDANTDWQDVIFQDGLAHDHNLSLRGNLGEIPFRISGGFTDKEGLIKTDNFNRLTYGLNLTPGLLDNTLQLNLSFKGMTDKNDYADQGAVGSAVFFDPTQPILDPSSPYGGYWTWTDGSGNPNTLSPANPLALLELTENTSDVSRYILGGQVDYRLPFLTDMRANLNLAYDRSKGEGSKYIPDIASFAFNTNGRSETYSQEIKNSLLEFFLNYNREISNDFALDLMGGYSWQHFWFENFFEATDADGEVVITDPDFNTREHYLLSLFGRANLTFYDNLLVTLTVRRDGTSRFSKDNRWGTFPGAAVAWKLIDNNPGTVNALKFRIGYGLTGQQGIGEDYYPYLARYRTSFTTAQYQLGDAYIATLRPQGYDANIKWEETSTFNVGFDYGFLDNRVNGSLEYYIRKSSDLINFVPIAAGTNLTNFLLTNVGDLENRGVELSINTIPWRKDKNEWNVGFNLAYNKNEITKLTATDDPNYIGVYTGGFSGGVGNNIQIHSVGHPAYSFYVYEQVYDAAGVPIEGLYVDRNGDGVITPDDQYHFEKSAPDVLMGFYTGLNVGKFDISAGARASIGNYVYNNNLSNAGTLAYIYNSGGGGYLNNTLAQTQGIDFSGPQYFSDFYVRNASFFRVDHITAGYDFGSLGNAIKSLRLSATIQNPILITEYDGIDPEIAVRDINNNVTTGIDNNIYPRSRTVLFGLNVQF